MNLQVTSHRGHHEACVLEPEVSKAIFEKLTGKNTEPLPQALKTKMPDTWADLEALWEKGQKGYLPFLVDEEKNLIPCREYSPEIKDILFLAPITGG